MQAMAKKVTTTKGQRLEDLALIHYGHTDGIMQLILDNPTVLNFADPVPAGVEILIKGEVINQRVVNEIEALENKPTLAIENLLRGFSKGFNNGFR